MACKGMFISQLTAGIPIIIYKLVYLDALCRRKYLFDTQIENLWPSISVAASCSDLHLSYALPLPA
jgi:hypothetical protein